jgi:DNA-binding NarL/FixJ family response regulator
MVRIILVDGSEIFRLGMRALLQDADDLTIVGEAADARAGEAAAAALGPDVVVADADLPDRTIAALAPTLRAAAPGARLLVLSTKVPEAAVKQALLAGAAGYAFKSQTPAEIVSAIREVGRGQQVMPTGAVSPGPSAPRLANASMLERLSTREREIFDLIIWGQTNKQVAVRLGISVKTVETHRSHINGKLQVHSAAELVRLASLCGALVEGEAPLPPGTRPQLVARTG